MHGVRSPDVAGKIARHLDRFAAFLLDGVRPRPVRDGHRPGGDPARDHLAATLVRILSDGRVMTMASAVSLADGDLPGRLSMW